MVVDFAAKASRSHDLDELKSSLVDEYSKQRF